MPRRPLRTLAALSLLVFHCGTGRLSRRDAGALDAATAASVRAILDDQMRALHITGAALAIVRDDHVIFMQTAGLRDREHNLPVTPDTLFAIGSCTKAFTSMEIARSADRGLLSLDDHPRRYLPYLQLADAEADAKVTVRDMLSHRTGLKAYADLAAEPGVLTREEYVRAATSAKPSAPFRTKFQYSNAMYSAAGEIAGRVNHSTWEKVIADDIFRPLNMSASVSVIAEMLPSPDHATGYTYDTATASYRATPPPKSLVALAPGGAIASSARDMAQWLRVLSGGGRIGDRQFVSPAMFRQLTRPMIEVSSTMSYALGWAVYDWNGLKVVEHNGGSEGISALVSFIPERHIGFVFLANSSPTAMTRLGRAAELLWPAILGLPAAIAKPASAATTPTAPSAVAVEVPSADALLARMIDAAGGERTLRAHTSVAIHARKTYDNQGVFADVTTQGQSPDRHNELEVWTAAGREIGRLRIYFDGTRGGQETTFGQDSVNDDAANARDRLQYAFPQLLAMQRMAKTITVRAGDNDTWIVESPAEKLLVSRATALVTGREREGEKTSFGDYRNVDGELVPFHSTIEDALGTSTVIVDSVRFNIAVDAAVFQPRSASVAR